MSSREEHNHRENKRANWISNFIVGPPKNNCSSYNDPNALDQVSNDVNISSSLIDIFDVTTNSSFFLNLRHCNFII